MSGILLEIGCGRKRTWPRGWTTLDCVRYKADVPKILCRLGEERIPLPDGSVRAVFGAHVVEHVLDLDFLFADLARVMMAGAVARFVVPDVEGLARDYVRYLDTGKVGKTLKAWSTSSKSIARRYKREPKVFLLARVYRGFTSGPHAHKWPVDRDAFRTYFRRHGFEPPTFPGDAPSTEPGMRGEHFAAGRLPALVAEARRRTT